MGHCLIPLKPATKIGDDKKFPRSYQTHDNEQYLPEVSVSIETLEMITGGGSGRIRHLGHAKWTRHGHLNIIIVILLLGCCTTFSVTLK